jgi:hypothetical protein
MRARNRLGAAVVSEPCRSSADGGATTIQVTRRQPEPMGQTPAIVPVTLPGFSPQLLPAGRPPERMGAWNIVVWGAPASK